MRGTNLPFYVCHVSVEPRASILDPQLTLGLPPGPTAATGIDALTHALESLVSARRNPYAHALGLEVVRSVSRWLPAAVANGQDLEARSRLLLAAHMAGLAFASTGLGLCHAVGHALSARLGVAHGVALAVVVPHVLAFNRPAVAELDAEVAAAMSGTSAAAAASALSERLGLPRTLADLGCTSELIPALVQDALADDVILNAPRPPSAEELTALLEAAL